MPTQVPKLLTSVRSWHFDPTVRTEEDVRRALLALNRGPFSAMAVNRCAYMVGDDGVTIHRCEFHDVPASYFLSAVALGSATDALASRVDKSAHLSSVRGFDTQLVSPGEVFTTPYDSEDGIVGFVTSDKTASDYFDFVVYSGDQLTTYSSKTAVRGLAHSGDLESLLHTVKGDRDLPDGVPMVLGVVGFQQKPLNQFMSQAPFVCIPHKERRTLFVVPCPLDEATVHRDTMGCLVVGRRVGAQVEWAVLSAPRTLAGIDTNTFTPTVHQCRDAAIAEANATWASAAANAAATQQQHSSAHAAAASLPSVPTHNVDSDETPLEAGVVMVVEQGLPSSVWSAVTATCVPQGAVPVLAVSGAGLSVARGKDGDLRPAAAALAAKATGTSYSVVLPVATGARLHGNAALALGEAYSTPEGACHVSARQYVAAVARPKCLRIVHVSDGMLEHVRDTAEQLMECVVVIHASSVNIPSTEKLGGGRELEQYLNRLPVSAVTALAGPLSMVVVSVAGRRYWYRGVAWPGVFQGDQAPAFGTRVSDEVSDQRLVNLFCGHGPSRAPLPRGVFTKGSTQVYYAARVGPHVASVAVSEALAGLCRLPAEELAQQRESCEVLFQQLPVMLSPAELDAVTSGIIHHVDQLTTASTAADKAALEAAIKAKAEAPVLASLGAALRARSKELKGHLQWLVDMVGRCVSVTKSSSRAFDLNRLVRRAVIAGNVASAKNMTFTQVCELMDRECHPELGAAIAHFNTNAVSTIVRSVSKGTFLKDRMDAPAFNATMTGRPLVELCPRMIFVDSITVGALKEAESSLTPLHNGTMGIATTVGAKKEVSLALIGTERRPALPLPLLTRFVDATDPTVFHWPTEANDASVAQLRILLRGTISACSETRTSHIAPNALDLGYGLVYVVLSAMLSLAGGSSNTAAANSSGVAFGDTRAQTMRGLFGLLATTLASGQRPLCGAWQLLSHTPMEQVTAPFEDQWWIYDGMLKCLPLTGWSMEPARLVLRRLLVLITRRQACGAALGPMQNRWGSAENAGQATADKEQRAAEQDAAAILAEVMIRCSWGPASDLYRDREAMGSAVVGLVGDVRRASPVYASNHSLHVVMDFFVDVCRRPTVDAVTFAAAFDAALRATARMVVDRSAAFAMTRDELATSLAWIGVDSDGCDSAAVTVDAVKVRHTTSSAAPGGGGSAGVAAAATTKLVSNGGGGGDVAASGDAVVVDGMPYAVGLLHGSVAARVVKKRREAAGRVLATSASMASATAGRQSAARWIAAVAAVTGSDAIVPPPLAVVAPSNAATTAVLAAVINTEAAAAPSSNDGSEPEVAAQQQRTSVGATAAAKPKWNGWGPVVEIFPPKSKPTATCAAAPPSTTPASTGGGSGAARPSSAAAKPAKKRGWGAVVEVFPPRAQGSKAMPTRTHDSIQEAAVAAGAGTGAAASVGSKATAQPPKLREDLADSGVGNVRAFQLADAVPRLTVEAGLGSNVACKAHVGMLRGWLWMALGAVSGQAVSEVDVEACFRRLVAAVITHWRDESMSDSASMAAFLMLP